MTLDTLSEMAQDVEVANPQDENTQTSEIAQETVGKEVQKEETPQELNFRQLRESRDEERQRRLESDKRLEAQQVLLEKVMLGDKKPVQEEVEEFEEDDIQNYGQTKKTIRREAEKIAKSLLAEERKRNETLNAPNKLKQEFIDFDSVVSTENVNYLIKNEPDLAAILNNVKDPYLQGKGAYKYIKTLGLDKKESVTKMKRDASLNADKPVSPNATIGRNSVGDANSFSRTLTPDLKKQLYKEMMQASNG